MSYRDSSSCHRNGRGGRRHGAGRSAINLDTLKDSILDLYNKGYTSREIAAQVSSTKSTIERRLAEWGIRKNAPKSQRKDPSLRSQVAIYFMSGFTDSEIVLALNGDRTGIDYVHKRTVERIRKSQGLVRRMSAFARQESNKQLWDIVERELDTGTIEGYGKGLLYTHFKNLGCQVSRYIS